MTAAGADGVQSEATQGPAGRGRGGDDDRKGVGGQRLGEEGHSDGDECGVVQGALADADHGLGDDGNHCWDHLPERVRKWCEARLLQVAAARFTRL